ncbi:hypothetical protein PhCBS80983_g03280 [Powellomyces hirtus]|uniref:Uncharacterized protein n=1 Tax=Powellomyces hirtus TaxID=109895 RepID=A0A507E2C8_9FUNG|nr:hypothetical protein PhCBS80983_g03280 [Powellomyces hirtus]
MDDGTARAIFVDRLLKNPRVLPSSSASGLASTLGHAAVVEVLLKDDRMDPSSDSNEALRKASANGHAAVVSQLLRHPKVDPSPYAFYESIERGHVAVMDVLLRDGRYDAAWRVSGRCLALWMADDHQQLGVVDRLMQDPRVDSTGGDSFPVVLAAGLSYVDILARLLQDARVNPNEPGIITAAVLNGGVAPTRLLLQHHSMNINDPFIMETTIEFCKIEILELLLADPRFDPAKNNNSALEPAIMCGADGAKENGEKMDAETEEEDGGLLDDEGNEKDDDDSSGMSEEDGDELSEYDEEAESEDGKSKGAQEADLQFPGLRDN